MNTLKRKRSSGICLAVQLNQRDASLPHPYEDGILAVLDDRRDADDIDRCAM
jgi:hypothetical protein